jgi:hypothetical protein
MQTQPPVSTDTSPGRASLSSGWRRGLAVSFRAVLVVQAVLVFAQATSAGQFLSGAGDWLRLHGTVGTAFIGLTLIVQTLLALAIWFPARGPAWPAILTALLFVAEWQQVEAGYGRRMALHIPLGMAIFGLVVALLAASRRLTR